MELPKLMQFQELPFNGDKFIEKRFLALKEIYGITTVVETGTCLGSTTIFLAKHFDRVFTIEINEQWRDIAISRINEQIQKSEIKKAPACYLGKSEEVLPMLIKLHSLGDKTIFFLDAHWGDYCPLQKELSDISAAGIKPIIAIHDFLVPGHPSLGYDEYNGQAFTYEWLKPYFDKIYGENQYWTAYNTDQESEGAKRGIIYLMPAFGKNVEITSKEDKLNSSIQDPPPGDQNKKANIIPVASLFINFYNDPVKERNEELKETLRCNINNKLIDKIYLVADDKTDFYGFDYHQKVEVIPYQSRPSYAEFFRIMNEAMKSPKEITILANSDIFITDSCLYYIIQHITEQHCFALSHWDKLADGTYRHGKFNKHSNVEVPKDDSQDVWVFKGKIKEVPNSNFLMGKPGCDNAIAYCLQKAGYIVCNPSKDIRPVHHHLSGVRNYNTTEVGQGYNPDRINQPYLLLPPITISEIPAFYQPAVVQENWIEKIEQQQNIGQSSSQFNEDAIIDYIFKNISTNEKPFYVDLGAGGYNGATISNTRALREKGWDGYGVDANPQTDLSIKQHIIKPDNIVELMMHSFTPIKFDFLNLDIDSCDFWVLEKILEEGYRPRLICTEFNGTLNPALSLVLKYEDGYMWDGTNKYGYSFAAGKKLLQMHGYTIVYNLQNVNIFAVRNDLIRIPVKEVTAIQSMYHPENKKAVWVDY